MLKKASIAAMTALLAATLAVPAYSAAAGGPKQMIVMQQSSKMYDNGQLFMATQPTEEKKGVTFVAARSLASKLGMQVTYNAKTKEYDFMNNSVKLRYKLNSASYTVNGTQANAIGAVYIKNGSLMVPLRSLVSPLGMTLALDKQQKRIVVSGSSTSVPNPTPTPDPGGETPVEPTEPPNPTDPPTTPTPPANEPPVARFITDKQSYRIGEQVLYTDQSTDDKGIVKTEWMNKQDVFFEPGNYTVTLRVTDKEGLSADYSLDVTVTNEILYTKEQYDRLFTKIGDKFPIDAASVLQFQALNYAIEKSGQQTLMRLNSPETIYEEGIYYSDTASGNVRFLLHHQNNRTSPVRIYLIATNTNEDPVIVTSGKIGIGGPSTYVSATGKNALARYLQGTNDSVTTVIPPGESRIVLREISNIRLDTGKVITAHADLVTSQPLRFTSVVVNDGRDPLVAMPQLPVLPWDGKHARGTFEQADRSITLRESLGGSPSRMVLADQTYDSYLQGYDALSGMPQVNSGNYGSNYTITLERVQPNTLIALNARGGHYGGAFLVNGKLTYMTTENILSNSSEAGVLYRTGSREEKVTIVFSPASGSNLPINLIFLPLPSAL
ncbi:stalk domain-containing protein [Paenibacillus sp. NPDC058071]|uniref:stalk domain-containing protein n=1 Tax=Paenibacillus sp. NPDC058071 TaxID=3346326 RepID=UPI0036DB646B